MRVSLAALLLFMCTEMSAFAEIRGCPRNGVAGAWTGVGHMDVDGFRNRISFKFDDYFVVTSNKLSGHMKFSEVASRDIPQMVQNALGEAYDVMFANESERFTFASNWGSGSGIWGQKSYHMVFRDHTTVVRVEEFGTVVNCDELQVHGKIFVANELVARMSAIYSRPSN